MATTVPVKELRADLADLLDQVADRREHLIITRRGRPATAIVPIDEYDSLEETAEILSDSAATISTAPTSSTQLSQANVVSGARGSETPQPRASNMMRRERLRGSGGDLSRRECPQRRELSGGRSHLPDHEGSMLIVLKSREHVVGHHA